VQKAKGRVLFQNSPLIRHDARVSPRDLTSLRLKNQLIAGSTARTPGEVVQHLGALQAQDYSGALWSIGLRLPHATEADVEKAVAARLIVRTWPMRGTLHFVAAADARWMLALLTPRILAGSVKRQQQLELTPAVFARCEKILVKALTGGKTLIREEVATILQQNGVPMDPRRGYHIPWRLAQEGVLCFGPRRDKQPTFVLLDEWLPPAKIWSREKALAELAQRYFTSHGPATRHDFAWWSGLTAAEARQGIEGASLHLIKATLEGTDYWMAKKQISLRDSSDEAYFLPGFDEYMLGYQNRGAALPSRHSHKIVPGGNGMFLPTVIDGGQVVGTWKKAATKKVVTLKIKAFVKLTAGQRQALKKPAQRYGEFLRLPCSY
jgi:hypothetical protein